MPDREDPAPTQPDFALVTNRRLPDWGPPYTETPADPTGPNTPLVAEPWNTVTATLFVVIAVAWLWRLRGRYRAYPFVSCCMPVLFAGGIGGMLFHGTRASPVYFLLDVIPISLLGLAGSMFMAVRLWGGRAGLFFPGILLFYLGLNQLFFRVLRPTNINWGVNLSYASLALVILLPIALVLVRTRFRHGGWVVVSLVSFGIAWVFRLVDLEVGWALPMGSHWLWHTFGAITTATIIEYFYLVEGEKPAAGTQRSAPPVDGLAG